MSWRVVALVIACGLAVARGAGADGDLGEARAYAHRPHGPDEKDLVVTQFTAAVVPRGWAVRTTIDLEIENPALEEVEAVLKLRAPPGAAVVRASLWVDGRRREALIGERRAVEGLYDWIVRGRRDPLLLRWAGEGWIEARLFPIAPHERRRFVIEWVEPLARDADGRPTWRVPVVAQRGRVVARPTRIAIAGRRVDARQRAWLELPETRVPPDEAIVVSPPRAREDGPRLAVVVGASVRARELLEGLLSALPERVAVDVRPADEDGLSDAALAAAPDPVPRLRGSAAAALGATYRLAVSTEPGLEAGRAAQAACAELGGSGAGVLVLVGLEGKAPASPPACLAVTGAALVVVQDARHVAEDARRAVELAERVVAPPDRADVVDWVPLRTVTGAPLWLGRDRDGGIVSPELEALWSRGAVDAPYLGDAALARRVPILSPELGLIALESNADEARLASARASPGAAVTRARSTRPPPLGVAATAIVSGRLSSEGVRRVVSIHRNEVRGCYERTLIGRPSLRGRVTLHFLIDPAGRVTAAHVTVSEIADVALDSCLVAAVRRWTFPRAVRGGWLEVVYPFQFEPVVPQRPESDA